MPTYIIYDFKGKTKIEPKIQQENPIKNPPIQINILGLLICVKIFIANGIINE